MIKPFGPKAAQFIKRPPEEDAKINILVGAIRSGKTWAINAKLLAILANGYWPGGIGLISGLSKTTVRTNLLNDILNIVGTSRYKYNQQSGELILCGKPFLVVGARDESSWKSIRGSTVGIFLGDECTLYPESFFQMALSRLSMPGSRAYFSTNPGPPQHYLKRRYLDNQELRDSGEIWSESWTLRDNPNITQDYIEFLERSYHGAWRSRYILGEWVGAEGSIYKDVMTDDIFYDDAWREANMPGLRNNGGHVRRLIGVDYGSSNPTVFMDIYEDQQGTWWVDREYYYDGREMNRTKTDSQYADDLVAFIGPVAAEVVMDPSAASFAAELATRGIFVTDADNAVMDGIRMVSTMMWRKKLRFNRACVNGIREFETYCWNDKSLERGVEEPSKAFSHCPDAVRYPVKTKLNEWLLAA